MCLFKHVSRAITKGGATPAVDSKQFSHDNI